MIALRHLDPRPLLPAVLARPRARGWIHVYCAAVAATAGVVLVVLAAALLTPLSVVAASVYVLAVTGMFATSALYHRYPWRRARALAWARRADHSMIFLLIAGTYTPFALLALPEPLGTLVLAVVWAGALLGVGLKVAWPQAPRWVGVPLYLVLGWVAVALLPELARGAGTAAMVLLVVGGGLYSLGAVAYAWRRPDPWPRTFGHHELFHAGTALAAACHTVAVWLALWR